MIKHEKEFQAREFTKEPSSVVRCLWQIDNVLSAQVIQVNVQFFRFLLFKWAKNSLFLGIIEQI